MSARGPQQIAASQWNGLRLSCWLFVGILLGCDPDAGLTLAADAGDMERQGPLRVARGPDGRPLLCQRDVESSDAVRELFCSDMPVPVTSLSELKQSLKNREHEQTPLELLQFPLLLGHSTALSGLHASSINPRAIFIGLAGAAPLLTFTRGVQQVEIAAMSRDRTTLRFYLLSFAQACNERPEGCKPSDLYTQRIEREWSKLELEDDEDLKNTALDCRQCHQRGRSTPRLLMRELVPPWTHFFEPLSQEPGLRSLPGVPNSDLTRDYTAAHGDEAYAGLALERLLPASGSLLQAAAGTDQPVLFSSQEILNERWPRTPDGNFPALPLTSTSWEGAYSAFKRGDQLALPYLEQRASDPDKLAALTAAYAAYRAGTLDELPDLGDVFPDDPMVRARIGLQTEPDATPVDTLIQGCGACHNDVLDQTLTRARFNIDLARMDAAELSVAIERMQRKPGQAGVMPPPQARQLDVAGKARLIEYLQTNARSGEPVPALVHAAQVGMTGGAAGL